MLLVEPNRTPWDLNFSILGFPVRVHPLFWLMCLLMGRDYDAKGILIVTAVFFVSILVHELGHALMIRRFGREAHVVLYMMGGLAIEGSGNPYASSYNPRGERRTAQEQIYISLAGPAAGFILAALAVIFAKGIGGEVVQTWYYKIIPTFDIRVGPQISPQLAMVLDILLYVNIFWGVVNLLPVYPLDGGQVAMQLCMLQDPYGGLVRGLQLSIGAGIVAVIFFLAVMGQGGLFPAMLFGSLTVSNYMALQQIQGGGGGYR
ncbi:metalloprotease [Anatilimnocola floriformis]|uniref:metalloprotease n=1 Tax=Anatilimnocola floriformis TaxID=2948575 RepID=UPI0020C56937|nr:site-2 protease family protein [Anatilimnocola floriformis]